MVKLCTTWTTSLGPPVQKQTLETDCGEEVTPDEQRYHNEARAEALEALPPVPGTPVIDTQKPPA